MNRSVGGSSVPNPCPCGYFGSTDRRCRCTPNQIERYLGKVSGPLLDRIDLHIDVPPVGFIKLRSQRKGLGSDEIRQQVCTARTIQAKRFDIARCNGRITTNATMSHRQVEQFCRLDTHAEMLLKQAMTEFGLSARAHDKICKVSRTIADLDNSLDIKPEHLTEAVSYRKLDRKL